MTFNLLFWLVMILWLLWQPVRAKKLPEWTNLLPWAAVALLGWRTFGPLVQG